MKKIIALSGKAESGKTTTLNILINLLSIVSDSFEISREYDSMATFSFNDTRISVCTPGDTGDILQENIDYFDKLPAFIKEGMAELTHGADDIRTEIELLVIDPSPLEMIFSGVKTDLDYAAGYIFFRYLAKQAANFTLNY